MRRIQYHQYGGPEEMRLEDFQPEWLKPDQVAVRVKAASINPVDWKLRNGIAKMMTGKTFPRGMGMDFSGVVESVGTRVTRLRAGDEVFGAARFKQSGAFAELLVTDAKLVAKKPAAVSFEQAACLPVAGATAWRGLVDKAHVKTGDAVFINGCYGGVGQAAVQIARNFGASVTGTCGAAALDDARRLGVSAVFDYTAVDLAALKGRFNIVFDTAGTLSMAEALALLAPGGVFLDINTTTPKFLRGLLTPQYKMIVANQNVDTLQQLAELAAAGKLQFAIGQTVPLDQAIALLTDIERGKKIKGKAVIVVG